MAETSKPYTRNGEVLAGTEVPAGIRRIALGLEYNGADFRGFQVQKHDPQTVQGHLHQALSKVADEPIELVCAGRTDAGVHATNQVVHFDTLADRPAKAWTMGVNTKLPDRVAVHWACAMPMEFHARFSARSRTYRYIIQNTRTRPGIHNGLVTWDKRTLNLSAMREAAAQLVGEHDFSSFRAAQCQAKNPVRRIHYLEVIELEPYIVIEISANAFLHHMVRNIVGVLATIASGEKPLNWVNEVLAAKDRTQGGITAPAAGLYLVKVEYPAHFNLPNWQPGPSFLRLPLVKSDSNPGS